MRKIELFFLGVIASGGALILLVLTTILLQILQLENFQGQEKFLIIVAVVIEELSKFVLLNQKLVREKNLSKNVSLEAISFGLGFSIIEISSIITQSSLTNEVFYGLFSIITIHASTSLLISLILSKFYQKSIIYRFFLAVIPAMGIHLVYNLNILHKNPENTLLIILLIFVSFFSLKPFWSSLRGQD